MGDGTMEAWVIRPERLGDPVDAMQLERIEVPDPGPGEVLVRVMAAGVNYNGVWASLGLPVSIFRYTGYDFHIAGSDASGVFEHVGAATFFTSVFVCKTFGTVVICGATSGFQLDFDVRYLWMRQKTILGSHFANAYECQRANQLIAEGKVQPVLSRVFPWSECPVPHQMMKENEHHGKMVVLVGAEREGEGRRDG